MGFLSRGRSAAQLRAAGAFALLPSGVGEIAETLGGWREQFGIERIVVSAELQDALAEVLRTN